MEKIINWGIIGLGNIANKFAEDLMLCENAKLYAVASLNAERAKAYSLKYHSEKYYNNYQDLAQDPEVDIVYIATPNAFHFENTMMCLKAGKSILCEKPLGLNSKEVRTMLAEAKLKNLFFMEALWTRFIPATEKVLDLIREEMIGTVKFIRADFGFKANSDPKGRVFNKKLGGGSLLDIGIYPIFLSLLTIGIPNDIKAMARITETDIDSYCAMLFDYEKGEKAILESTVEAKTPTEAFIYGEKGMIKMHQPFHHSKRISFFKNDEQEDIIDIEHIGNGYYHEIVEACKCINEGKIESEKLPHSFSLNLMEIIDRVKQEIGLKYDTD